MFIQEYMGYSEYLLEARHAYEGDLTSLDKFYLQCAVAPEISELGPGYMDNVNKLAAKAKTYFDSRDLKDEKFPLAIRYPKPIESLGTELENIAQAALPWFEKKCIRM